MSAKFHLAMACPSAAYRARKLFYTKLFAVEFKEGHVVEGENQREYLGSSWEQGSGNIFDILQEPDFTEVKAKLTQTEFIFDGYSFTLLEDTELAGDEEKFAHSGFIFNTSAEFDAAIKKRSINANSVKAYPTGEKQAYQKDENGIVWEFLYIPPTGQKPR